MNESKKAQKAMDKANANENAKEIGKKVGTKALQSFGVPPGVAAKAANKIAENKHIKKAIDRTTNNSFARKALNDGPLNSMGSKSGGGGSSGSSNSNQEAFDKLNESHSPLLPSERDNENYESVNVNFPKPSKKNIYMIIAGAAGLLFSVILFVGFLRMAVEPISILVGGIEDAATETANFADTFSEKIRNLLKYGKYETNEQTLFDKIIEKNNEFKSKYYRSNVPLISATLYFDGNDEEFGLPKVEIDDGKGGKIFVDRITNEKLDNRLKYLDEVFNLLLIIKEDKIKCNPKYDEEGKLTFDETYISSEDVKIVNEGREGQSCEDLYTENGELIGDGYKYVYRSEYDEEGYAERLMEAEVEATGEELVRALYPELLEEVKGKKLIVDEIMVYYEVWEYLYEEEDEGIAGSELCYFPGGITSDLMGGLGSPINGSYRITSQFGLRVNPFPSERAQFPMKFHNGIDLVPTQDKTIYAAASGIVIRSGFGATSGNSITIKHTSGGKEFFTTYHHFRDPAFLKVGAPVTIGQPIGIVGSTGKSTGTHLHFEIYHYVNGKRTPVNPAALFGKAINLELDCFINEIPEYEE